jgi:hypothetical protein
MAVLRIRILLDPPVLLWLIGAELLGLKAVFFVLDCIHIVLPLEKIIEGLACTLDKI